MENTSNVVARVSDRPKLQALARKKLFADLQSESDVTVVADVADCDLLQKLARERAMRSARTKRGRVISTILRDNPHLGWNPTEARW